jgi:hypothetical protein
MLSVCLKQLVHFHGIQQGGHAIEGHLNTIPCNPLVLTVPKWWAFKLLGEKHVLRQSASENEELGLVTMNTTPFSRD